MSPEKIIEMAKQAGWSVWFNDDGELQFFEAFAKLVAQHEREACAKIADQYVGQDLEHNFSALVAHNIRARGQLLVRFK